MLAFETIGNATLICFDEKPIIVTDPWISGNAYFGSWGMPYDIPLAQREAILDSEYIWFSHGHPDHLDGQSLDYFKGQKILLPDHVGGRIFNDLTKLGFRQISILPDRKWVKLSPKIEVMCVGDYYQDAILLVNINGRLLVNLNDASDKGWANLVRKIIKKFDKSFLLKLFSYGDPDMNNFYDESGAHATPLKKFELGKQMQYWSEFYGTNYVIPFSSTHYYQRSDSIWANEYIADFDDLKLGLTSTQFELLPPFIHYDCSNDTFFELNPAKIENRICKPEDFGDHWSDTLDKEDKQKIKHYFTQIEALQDYFDFIRFIVGKEEFLIDLPGRRRGRKKNNKVGVTFEAPRGSLMTSICHEIFDDMLIGNFMKTTLHQCTGFDFSTQFAAVGKYADNGQAKKSEELANYFTAYKQRAFLDFVICQFKTASEQKIRRFIPHNSVAFNIAKSAYKLIKI